MTIINALKNSKLKAIVNKVVLAGVVAAAAFMATPQKANAQVAIGVRFGHTGYVARVPVYQAPVYGGYTNYGPYAPVPYAYGYGYDHARDWDRHDFDRRDFDRRDFDRGRVAERDYRGYGRR